MLEENLGGEDAKEWNWQALAHQINTRCGLKTTDRQLKQIGKDNLIDRLAGDADEDRSRRWTWPRASRSWSRTGA